MAALNLIIADGIEKRTKYSSEISITKQNFIKPNKPCAKYFWKNSIQIVQRNTCLYEGQLKTTAYMLSRSMQFALTSVAANLYKPLGAGSSTSGRW